MVGRLKVIGLSRSAAHKRIFILASSLCCERANRTGGYSTLCLKALGRERLLLLIKDMRNVM